MILDVIGNDGLSVFSPDDARAGTVTGAPTDEDIDLVKDGWMKVDTEQANGRLYWRANGTWHYTNATAGFEVPAHETVCPKCGKPIKIDDAVVGVIESSLSDGALHGLWCHVECAQPKRKKLFGII